MRSTYLLGSLLLLVSFVLAGSDAHQLQRGEAVADNSTATAISDVYEGGDPWGGVFGSTEFAQNGCHSKNDAIGSKCSTPFVDDNFRRAVIAWCGMYDNKIVVPTGQSYLTRMTQWPCGTVGGPKCDFVGNIRVDRDSDNDGVGSGWNYIDNARCSENIDNIWKQCGGMGGWWNTAFGTVFMECIQPQ